MKSLRGRPFNSLAGGGGGGGEGGGGGWQGVGDFWSSRIFSASNLVGRIFFPFFPMSFLLHLCSMQFFSSDKHLQEIFFQNQPPPSPSRVQWLAPKPFNFIHSVFVERCFKCSRRSLDSTILYSFYAR